MSLSVSGYIRQFYKGNIFGATSDGRNGQPSNSLFSADMKALRQAVRGLGDYNYKDEESDGISGYSFDRPAFTDMMANLSSIDIIVAKDLSRIGRHNAKVLLFLEEMEEQGKRVILIDDHYDSLHSDDDIIGIKTC